MLKKFEGEKRKQYTALGVAVALLGGGMFLLSEIFGKKKEEKREGPPVKVEAPPPKKTEEETLRALYGEKITQLEKRIAERPSPHNLHIALLEYQTAPPFHQVKPLEET